MFYLVGRRWPVGRWLVGGLVENQSVGWGSMVGGSVEGLSVFQWSVEDLSVRWWSVVGGR